MAIDKSKLLSDVRIAPDGSLLTKEELGGVDPSVALEHLKKDEAVPPPPTAEQTAEQRTEAFKDAGVTPTPVQPSTAAISTTDLSRATELPDAASFAETQPAAVLSDATTAVAGKTLTATGQAIDALISKQEAAVTAEKEVEAAKVADVEGRIETLGEERVTAAQDILQTTREKFETEQTIQSLRSVETKILAAQEALEIGIIYEMNRPARQQLLVGRASTLQQQGLATIGALQSSAQILQGNIDLAESYAQTTIDAVLTDNQNAMNSLNTLLTLHNNKLVTLTADEKDIVDTRITALKDQNKEVQDNKTDVFNLMAKYPSASVDGGVTLLDSKETALKKMLPHMAAEEVREAEAEGKVYSAKDLPGSIRSSIIDDLQDATYAEAVGELTLDTLSRIYPEVSLDTLRELHNEFYDFEALQTGVSGEDKKPWWKFWG